MPPDAAATIELTVGNSYAAIIVESLAAWSVILYV